MKLDRPYKRIIRPFERPDQFNLPGLAIDNSHIADSLYAADRFEIIRAYHTLEKDLINLFEYVEPADANLKTYSYRIYEMLLRASTEFEQNAKKILMANGYTKKGNWTMDDYAKINAATRLDEYRLLINVWANGQKEIRPFSDWTAKNPLTWYKGYNLVKHNRHEQFEKASFENLINAVAAVFAVVFAQFFIFVFNEFQSTSWYLSDDITSALSSQGSLFSIIPPTSWAEEEMYRFDWRTLKFENNPFQNYPF
ncbi:hypothetical protein [Spirosoma fluminis]